jgi:hypothetical protein
MVGAAQPALHPGGGIKRFGIARLTQQQLHLLDQSAFHGRHGCALSNKIQIACRRDGGTGSCNTSASNTGIRLGGGFS